MTVGGVPIGNPTLIASVAEFELRRSSGNNAQVRVILDGNQTGGATGLVLAASQSIIRGLAIEGFGVGISIPSPADRRRPDPGKLDRRVPGLSGRLAVGLAAAGA